MTIREEMRNLTEEIVGSYADRIATITELRETVKLDLREVRTHLEELRDSRVAGGKEIKADLARDAASRKHQVGSMLNDFNAGLEELNSAHTAMSRELKADLAKSVAYCKHSVGAILDGFGQALAVMSEGMRADLAKGVVDRKRKVSIIKRDVGVLLGGFSAELKELRSELAGGRDEWQKMAATIPSKRGGGAVAVKTLIEEIAEEAAEITPETAALYEQVFEYLANHPDGTKMTELEKVFGLARIQMAKVIRNLMDENKVEKQELLYFAV